MGALDQLKEGRCYCSNKLDLTKLDSEWGDEHHYKSIQCTKCGKKNWIKTDYSSSGHDSLEEKTIEEVVKKVQQE